MVVDSAFKNCVSSCKTMKMIIQETHSHLILRYTYLSLSMFVLFLQLVSLCTPHIDVPVVLINLKLELQNSSTDGIFTSRSTHPFKVIETDTMSIQSMTSLGRVGRILAGSIDPSGEYTHKYGLQNSKAATDTLVFICFWQPLA